MASDAVQRYLQEALSAGNLQHVLATRQLSGTFYCSTLGRDVACTNALLVMLASTQIPPLFLEVVTWLLAQEPKMVRGKYAEGSTALALAIGRNDDPLGKTRRCAVVRWCGGVSMRCNTLTFYFYFYFCFCF